MAESSDFLPFVKSQAEFHERQAVRHSATERRRLLHTGTAKTFRELETFLADLANKAPKQPVMGSGLSLSWSELQDLPDELVAELSITESDKLDYNIIELIDRHGGTASLDRILVEVYRLTGQVMKRSNLNARIYRMTQKGMIHSVAGKKGVYTTEPPSDQESEPELNSNA